MLNAVKQVASSLFADALVGVEVGVLNPLAPLLEKEWNSGLFALIAQRTRPIAVHGPRAVAGFAADDHPKPFVVTLVFERQNRRKVDRAGWRLAAQNRTPAGTLSSAGMRISAVC